MSQSLAPHLAWPVRASEIRRSLGTDADAVKVVLVHWDKRGSQVPMTASWVPGSSDQLGGAGASLWVRPVARTELIAVRAQMLAVALPDAVAWTQEALRATEVWGMSHHERRWLWAQGSLRVQDDDGMHILDRERGGRR